MAYEKKLLFVGIIDDIFKGSLKSKCSTGIIYNISFLNNSVDKKQIGG